MDHDLVAQGGCAMRLDRNVILYSAVTLLVLYGLASRLAPYRDPSVDGCEITYVYDGDTVELTCPSETRSARLVGFDTPETREPGCAAEAALGAEATGRLRQIVAAAQVLELSPEGYDKFGRQLIDLTADGRDIGDLLVDEGLAVAYRGGSRIDWCDRLGG